MLALILTLLTSAVACLILIPLVRRLAVRNALVDRPDGRRKVQSRPVPLGGGIAVLASAFLGAAASAMIPGLPRDQLATLWPTALGLGLAAAVICGVGVADDFRLLRGRHKLLGQILAVAIVIGFGVVVRSINIFGWQVELGLLALPFTAFLLLGAINSLNLLDGMDGMLGSVGGIICLALAGMAALAGHWAVAGLAAALGGALLAFLRYNLPPASIYLGDSGSMLVGLVVGSLAIESSLKAPTTIALSAPVVLLTLPIFDTAAAIIRRKLTGRSIYTTDRGHLHHCLLRHGYSVRRVLLLVCSFSVATGLSVLASEAFNNEWIALLTGLTVVGVLIATRLFGFAEMVLVKERLRSLGGSLFQGGVRSPIRQIEVRLQGSADWKELWDAITASAWELNLRQVRLDVNAPSLHEGYHARWDRGQDEGEASHLWRAEIPLKVRGLAVGRLEVVGQPDDEPMWVKIAALTKALEGVADALPFAAPKREVSVRIADWQLVPVNAEV
jgi:UDP-GlcNAc:undecaprenyl-phosphate/decaprenyl-phosphate GlcNAc-1-phosphate transferase